MSNDPGADGEDGTIRPPRRVTLAGFEWEPEDLSHALALVGGPWTACGATRWLDPRNVLATPWSPRRLARCRRRTAAGERAPPARVEGHRVGARTFYRVSDGMHRTTAAAEAGSRVLATIAGHHAAEPGERVVAGGWLWERPGPGGPASRSIVPVTADEVALLARLGVEVADAWSKGGGPPRSRRDARAGGVGEGRPIAGRPEVG